MAPENRRASLRQRPVGPHRTGPLRREDGQPAASGTGGAEREGFEPPGLAAARFQGGCNRPLCHRSGAEGTGRINQRSRQKPAQGTPRQLSAEGALGRPATNPTHPPVHRRGPRSPEPPADAIGRAVEGTSCTELSAGALPGHSATTLCTWGAAAARQSPSGAGQGRGDERAPRAVSGSGTGGRSSSRRLGASGRRRAPVVGAGVRAGRRVRAEELHVALLGVEVAEASAISSSAMWPSASITKQ